MATKRLSTEKWDKETVSKEQLLDLIRCYESVIGECDLHGEGITAVDELSKIALKLIGTKDKYGERDRDCWDRKEIQEFLRF